jgi:cytosine deaminase
MTKTASECRRNAIINCVRGEGFFCEEEEGSINTAKSFKKYLRLNAVRVPLSTLSKEVLSMVMEEEDEEEYNEEGELEYVEEEEGLRLMDVIVHRENGTIERVVDTRKASSKKKPRFVEEEEEDEDKVECGKCILVPAFVDAHVHLVKTHAGARCRNPTGSIADALVCETADQPRWKVGADVERRMDFAIASALHYGTIAMRTHLDGTNNVEDKALRDQLFEIFRRKRDELKEKEGAFLQGVCNLFLPLWSEPRIAEEFARVASESNCEDGSLLFGAYCGVIARDEDDEDRGKSVEEARRHFENLFFYANKYGLNVDIHIDETNDPNCCAILPCLEGFLNGVDDDEKDDDKRYTKSKFENIRLISLSHACSLSLQPKATLDRVVELVKRIESNTNARVSFIVNPLTNLGLQDRRGTTSAIGLEVDANMPRTPLWRGIAPIQELDAEGLNCCAGSDNVRDWWHPYADYDCLNTLKLAIELAHLNTVPNEGYWTKLVASNACRAMFPDVNASSSSSSSTLKSIGAIGPNYRANFVLFPSSRRFTELFSRSQHDRLVFRQGTLDSTDVPEHPLPEYEKLDDLFERKTNTTALFLRKDDFTRGATKIIPPT